MDNAAKLTLVIDARRSLIQSGEVQPYKVAAVLDTVLWLMEQDLKERTTIKEVCGER